MSIEQKESCLFIGDPNLGSRGEQILYPYFPHLQAVIWNVGDLGEKQIIRQFIRSRKWSLAISFYSDFILRPEDLTAIDLPLNIHPALPHLPGLGYDIIPILEEHDSYGATLHWMDEKIDHGEIFDVIEYPLPAGTTRAMLRKWNQHVSLELLARWSPRLAACNSCNERLALLRDNPASRPRWGKKQTASLINIEHEHWRNKVVPFLQ